MHTRCESHKLLESGLARATLALGLAAALGVSAQVAGLGGPSKGTNGKLTCGLEAIPGGRASAPAATGAVGAAAPTLEAAAVSLLPIRGDCVLIDAVAAGSVETLRAELVALGLRQAAVSGRMVSGLLPVGKVAQLARLESLKFARPAYCTTNAGSVTSQGDAAQWSDVARSRYGVGGTGVTVGVLSDSFGSIPGGVAADVASGDLPAGCTVLADLSSGVGSDEGRAMMQIVHDVAPGAAMQFHSAFNGQADFAQGIRDLVDNGCDVIVDDVVYFSEAMFQDDNVAQATDYARAHGVAYFCSAGNRARQSYESAFRDSGMGGYLGLRHDFDPGPGLDGLMTVTVGASGAALVLQWDEPYYSISGPPGSASDVDIIAYDMDGNPAYGSAAANVGGDPLEIFILPAGQWQIGVEMRSGPQPGRFKIIWQGALTVQEWGTRSSTTAGHANAAGSEAVGAARYDKTPVFGVNPPLLEYFSSAGGTPILFDTAGNRLAAPVYRAKPGIVAPDGANTTFLGQPYDGDPWPNFFGTSAAAPHAAGVAALLLEANGSLTPVALNDILHATAVDMDAAGFDNNTGYGLVRADDAVFLATPPGPDLVVPVLGHASPALVARYLGAGQAYVRCQQANQGLLAARSCVLRFWLSSDALLSKGADQMLAVGPVRSLGAGQKAAVANTLLRLGRRLATGETVYIIAEVDADGAVAEMFEANNTAVLKLVGP